MKNVINNPENYNVFLNKLDFAQSFLQDRFQDQAPQDKKFLNDLYKILQNSEYITGITTMQVADRNYLGVTISYAVPVKLTNAYLQGKEIQSVNAFLNQIFNQKDTTDDTSGKQSDLYRYFVTNSLVWGKNDPDLTNTYGQDQPLKFLLSDNRFPEVETTKHSILDNNNRHKEAECTSLKVTFFVNLSTKVTPYETVLKNQTEAQIKNGTDLIRNLQNNQENQEQTIEDLQKRLTALENQNKDQTKPDADKTETKPTDQDKAQTNPTVEGQPNETK